jgi:hypothetical protein
LGVLSLRVRIVVRLPDWTVRSGYRTRGPFEYPVAIRPRWPAIAASLTLHSLTIAALPSFWQNFVPLHFRSEPRRIVYVQPMELRSLKPPAFPMPSGALATGGGPEGAAAAAKSGTPHSPGDPAPAPKGGVEHASRKPRLPVPSGNVVVVQVEDDPESEETQITVVAGRFTGSPAGNNGSPSVPSPGSLLEFGIELLPDPLLPPPEPGALAFPIGSLTAVAPLGAAPAGALPPPPAEPKGNVGPIPSEPASVLFVSGKSLSVTEVLGMLLPSGDAPLAPSAELTGESARDGAEGVSVADSGAGGPAAVPGDGPGTGAGSAPAPGEASGSAGFTPLPWHASGSAAQHASLQARELGRQYAIYSLRVPNAPAESRNSAVFSLPPEALRRLASTPPIRSVKAPDDSYDIVIVQGAPSASTLRARNLLKGDPIYTVYVDVGASSEWTMRFCLPPEEGESGDTTRRSRTVVKLEAGTPLKAPFPLLTEAAAVTMEPRSSPITISGKVNAGGQFEELKVVSATAPEIEQMLITSLERWSFRPATRDGQPVAVDVVLTIPPV